MSSGPSSPPKILVFPDPDIRAGLAQSRRAGAQVLGSRGRHTQRGSQGGKEREEDPEGGRLASEQPLEPG